MQHFYFRDLILDFWEAGMMEKSVSEDERALKIFEHKFSLTRR